MMVMMMQVRDEMENIIYAWGKTFKWAELFLHTSTRSLCVRYMGVHKDFARWKIYLPVHGKCCNILLCTHS